MQESEQNKDVDELWECIAEEWEHLHQSVIDSVPSDSDAIN